MKKTREVSSLPDLHLIEPRWRTEFLCFIETGEASPEFLRYLDANEDCQKAVEAAFRAQVGAFEDFARALNAWEQASRDDYGTQLRLKGKRKGAACLEEVEKSTDYRIQESAKHRGEYFHRTPMGKTLSKMSQGAKVGEVLDSAPSGNRKHSRNRSSEIIK